jgi:L-alanine-DL-glutamate epimerase-like enolase superfamily enzyme
MKLEFSSRTLHPRRTFRISRAAKTEAINLLVRVERDGISGLGEASPNPFYRETPDQVLAALGRVGPRLAGLTPDSVEAIGGAWEDLWRFLKPSRAAQCALDLALWEWLAKARGLSVCELALGRKPRPVVSFATLPITGELEFQQAFEELKSFRRIKIKCGPDMGLEPVRLVRDQSAAILAVDANASWSVAGWTRAAEECSKLGVTFVEQPLSPDQDTAMAELLKNATVAVMADESCVGETDVERMPGRFSGFNIKLVKCGGLTPALRMLRRGKELGLATMVGCMLETSALIAAGAVVAQATDYADLDGAWLLADDPFVGLPLTNGILTPPDAPGWGLSLQTLRGGETAHTKK